MVTTRPCCSGNGWSGRQTVLDLEPLRVDHRWLLACTMLVVSSAGRTVCVLCTAIVAAGRERRGLLPAFLHEVQRCGHPD